MSVKSVFKGFFVTLSLLAIGLCSAIAIKEPNVIPNLIGIKNDDDINNIQSVPYFVNFGDLGSGDTSYKTQYFKYGNRSWYLAWGNHGQQKDHTEEDGTIKNRFNMLLGWNENKKPTYGSYSYTNQVMREIKVNEDFNYSFIIMDFDFIENHNCDFSFSALENLSSSNTSLYFIASHNSGSSWSVIDSIDSTNLTKDNKQTFTNVENNLFVRSIRYGMVLVSDAKSARIELDQFVVSNLSVEK